ncbi:MAG: M23 family metallopeptidase [candidate division Zixibacteria bacterium]|nr:M23 family metallopeptidase [candidate division Zixibacteria bacterium]
MLKNKITFMVIPDSKGIAKQVSIPVVLLYSATAIVFILLVANFFLGAEFITNQVSDQELGRLRAENKDLMEKYEQVRWDLSEVDARYQDLVQKEIAIRTIFDLPEINSEERQLGTGGPGSQTYPNMTPSEKVAFATEVEVDRLLKLSQFELEKYEDVEELLENYKDRLDHTPSILPAKGWLSCGFGMRNDPFTGYRTMHRGVDIANHIGTPVVATADGVVKQIGQLGNMGRMITIDHGYGFVSRYGHLSKFTVKKGQKIKRGEVVGLMGNSGKTTGPHLHYEVWRNGQAKDPMNFILNNL